MSRLAIELNDIAVLGRTEQGDKFSSPGFALVDGEVTTGALARDQARLQPSRVFHRFWEQLSLEALPAAVRGAGTQADLAFRHLQQLWGGLESLPEHAVVAVPASYTRGQLSLLLGIARECNIPVRALIDTAIASSPTPQPGAQLLHLDLMLNQVVISRLSQGRRLRREKVEVINGAGLLNLYTAWATDIANLFVRNTRYDPMHSAAAEQQFYNRLPGWLNDCEINGTTLASVDHGDKQHGVELQSKQLAESVQPVMRQIQRTLASLSRPGEQLLLMLTDKWQQLPGVHQHLGEAGYGLLDLPHGAAASGALARFDEIIDSSGGVNYVTSLNWDRAMAPQATPPPGDTPMAQAPPTHVILGHRAWPLHEQPLVFGSEPGEQGDQVVLAVDLHGVSARHCSLQRRGNEVQLADHSRFGTFVNNRRVEGQVIVHSGDIVRLGGSTEVLQLVREQRTDGG